MLGRLDDVNIERCQCRSVEWADMRVELTVVP